MSFEQKLLCLPSELHPTGPTKGAHAFMVHSPRNSASIQVIFKARAFFLKTNQHGDRFIGEGRTIAWKKYGGPKACWAALQVSLEW
jgi:hypothetical protein